MEGLRVGKGGRARVGKGGRVKDGKMEEGLGMGKRGKG